MKNSMTINLALKFIKKIILSSIALLMLCIEKITMYKNPGILMSFWVILGSLASEMSLGGGGGPLDFIVSLSPLRLKTLDLSLTNELCDLVRSGNYAVIS